MQISSKAFLLNATVGVVALGTLMAAGTSSAFALSAGCARLNGSQVFDGANLVNSGLPNTGALAYSAGEVITVSTTGNATVRLLLGNQAIIGPGAGFTYTIPASGTVPVYFVDRFNQGDPTGWSITWSCSAGGAGSSVPSSLAPMVATISQQMIAASIDGAIGDAFSPNGTPTNFTSNGGFINFAATPKSEIEQRTDDAFSALAYAKDGKQPSVFKAPSKSLDREWSVWADIRGTGFKANDTSAAGNNSAGTQYNITGGVGRKLNSETLIGLFVGYEGFKHDIASLGATLKGNGETIGGYFARRIGTQLRFDAWLGLSNVNYNSNAAGVTGSFIGSRWMANTGLTYTQAFGQFTHEPSAKIYVLWESDRAWTDSAGTAQASRNFTAGRTAVGDKISRAFVLANGITLTPSFGLYGDWRFQTSNAIPTGTTVANISSGWSARTTAGLSTKLSNGSTLSLNGEYGGIGANYKIWTGNARAVMPF